MRYRPLIVVARLAYALIAPSANADTTDLSPLSQAEIDAARERMLEAILRAREEGAVRIRAGSQPTPPQTVAEEDPASESGKSADEPRTRSCPDTAVYLAAKTSSHTDIQKRIDALRSVITTPDAQGKVEASEALAREYLKIGFFAEARAIAAAGVADNDRQGLVLALSNFGAGNWKDATRGLAKFADCDEAISLLHFAALLEEEEAAALSQLTSVSAHALTRIEPALASLAAERIALFALDHGEREKALGFYAVALAARNDESSPILTILEDAFSADFNALAIEQEELIKLAKDQGESQDRAIMAIARDADAHSLPYDGFVEDLAGADPGANTDSAIRGARFLVSAGRLGAAIDLLRKNKQADVVTDTSLNEARSLIQQGLKSEESHTRLSAIDAYVSNLDVLASPQLTEAVSLELAKWDASTLIKRIIDATPDLPPNTSERLRLLALPSEQDTSRAHREPNAQEISSMYASSDFPSNNDERTKDNELTSPNPASSRNWAVARALHRKIEEEITLINGGLGDE